MDEYIEQNRRLWNAWTGINAQSEMYNLEGFRQNPMRLHALERAEMGDVAGQSLLHLQCHFGLDTLSWATLGATVTGADFADESVRLASRLSAELGIPARFVQSDVYALPDTLDGQFDRIFTSYGAINWLPDLPRWAEVIAHFLKPGGVFYMVEFHPVMYMFDDSDEATDLRVAYPYFHGDQPLRVEGQGSYADRSVPYHSVEHVWVHGLGDIVSALGGAGLRIEYLHEFPYTTEQYTPLMVHGSDGLWRMPPDKGDIPCLFSIRATR
jgi:SAM-dependent methyltransferase